MFHNHLFDVEDMAKTPMADLTKLLSMAGITKLLSGDDDEERRRVADKPSNIHLAFVPKV